MSNDQNLFVEPISVMSDQGYTQDLMVA